jgi:REP element-mobilizing transposase RayT
LLGYIEVKSTELLTYKKQNGINYQRGDFVPRKPRIKSESGIYHIIMRGINRQTLFEDEEDCIKFIKVLERYKDICQYKLFAYCLMNNHLHLLLKEGKEPLETVMRRICGSYVFWYNKKYDRIGYLFQDRFKSEPVEGDEYFLIVLRYIIKNPIKAGITNRAKDYKWTNYYDYIEENKLTDTDFVLDIFNEASREYAVNEFIEYINKEDSDECMDIPDKRQLTDKEAIKIIKECCRVDHGIDLQKLETEKRDLYIRRLKKLNLSIRQIERLTGISRGIIQKV